MFWGNGVNFCSIEQKFGHGGPAPLVRLGPERGEPFNRHGKIPYEGAGEKRVGDVVIAQPLSELVRTACLGPVPPRRELIFSF